MTYQQLMYNVGYCQAQGLQCGSIGRSVLGRDIPYIRIGKGSKSILIQAAIHAREYSTATIVLLQVRDLLNVDMQDYSMYYVPMSNPDGVEIVLNGLDSVPSTYLKHKLKAVNPSGDWKMFKANANCVDLNTNFDARWGKGLGNIRYPDIANYVGKFANDQVETMALVDFALKLSPVATMSYHSRGREIYWDFFAPYTNAQRDLAIAESLAACARYNVVSSQDVSAGGFKDWCIQYLKIPSFTIEFFDSDAKYPLTQDQIVQEHTRTRQLPIVLMDSL
ncbi:MAG: hypothetical protein LBK70_02045 [Clostridiales bacterium]|nr:hypothetical protein [Clostridiales bacterium]